MLALVLPGCGGGSSGTGAFSSGFNKTAPLGTLTSEQRTELCDKFQSFVKQKLLVPDVICPFAGVVVGIHDGQQNFLTSPSALCEEVVPVCFDRFDEFAEAAPPLDCPIKPDDLFQCAVPIGTLEQCINDMFDLVASVLSGLNCSLADKFTDANDFVDSLSFAPPSTPACNEIRTKCPNEI